MINFADLRLNLDRYRHFDNVFLGCSGGPDSMFLLSLLKNWKNLVVCHINYHFRSCSDKDTEIVRNFCLCAHLPLFVFHFRGCCQTNLQAFARNWRFQWFLWLNQQLPGKNCLFLAHQQEDDLVTFFLQEKRRLIPNYFGLSATSYYQNLLVVRPLLAISKQNIFTALKQQKTPFAIDDSNANLTYERNYMNALLNQKITNEDQLSALLAAKQKANLHLLNLKKIVARFAFSSQSNFLNYQAIKHNYPLTKVLILQKFIAFHINQPSFQVKLNFSYLLNLLNLINTSYKHSFFHQINNQYLFFKINDACFVVKKDWIFNFGYEISNFFSWQKCVYFIPASLPNNFFDKYKICNAKKVSHLKLKFNYGNKTVNKYLKDLKIIKPIRDIYPVIIDKATNLIIYIFKTNYGLKDSIYFQKVKFARWLENIVEFLL